MSIELAWFPSAEQQGRAAYLIVLNEDVVLPHGRNAHEEEQDEPIGVQRVQWRHPQDVLEEECVHFDKEEHCDEADALQEPHRAAEHCPVESVPGVGPELCQRPLSLHDSVSVWLCRSQHKGSISSQRKPRSWGDLVTQHPVSNLPLLSWWVDG